MIISESKTVTCPTLEWILVVTRPFLHAFGECCSVSVLLTTQSCYIFLLLKHGEGGSFICVAHCQEFYLF